MPFAARIRDRATSASQVDELGKSPCSSVQRVSRCSSCELARIQVHRGREGGHVSRRYGQLITHILLSTHIQYKALLSPIMLPIAGERCPYCGSRNICVSLPTNIWEELAILLTLRPGQVLGAFASFPAFAVHQDANTSRAGRDDSRTGGWNWRCRA